MTRISALALAFASACAPKVNDPGDVAIVSLAGKATGTYRGKPFADGSKGFDVFAKRDGRWQVVYSQMTSIKEQAVDGLTASG